MTTKKGMNEHLMAKLTPQFKDLVEVENPTYYDGVNNLSLVLQRALPEFSFAVIAPGGQGPSTKRLLEANGFIHLATMQNWWPTHVSEAKNGERPLHFWWRVNPEPNNYEPPPVRKCWSWSPENDEYNDICAQLAHSGCGFKLGDICRRGFKAKDYFKYFSLIRVPLKPSSAQKRWLDKCHYRHITTGTLAQFWVNGWPAEDYTAWKEKDFWRRTDAKYQPETRLRRYMPLEG